MLEEPFAECTAPSDRSRVFPLLPPELFDRVISFLPPNEVPCTVRLLNSAAAAHLSSPAHRTVHVSQCAPVHAFLWRWLRPDSTRNLTRRQREQLLCLTASSGCLVNLTALVCGSQQPAEPTCTPSSGPAPEARRPKPYRPTALGTAVTCPLDNRTSHFQCRLSEEALEAAAASGHQDCCSWLLSHGCPCDQEGVLAAAAGGGHVPLCAWLVQKQGLTPHPRALYAAARGGHTPAVAWLKTQLQQQGVEWDPGRLLVAAAAGCSLVEVQEEHEAFMEQHRMSHQQQHERQHTVNLPQLQHGGDGEQPPLPAQLQPHQSHHGATVPSRLHLLRSPPLPKAATLRLATGAAAASSSPDWQLKTHWLAAQLQMHAPAAGAVPGSTAGGPLAPAALSTDLGCEQLLISQSDWRDRLAVLVRQLGLPAELWARPLSVMALHAAQAGNMEALRELRAMGAYLDCNTAVHAAAGGQLGALRELCGWGCGPVGWGAAEEAARRGHVGVLEWLLERHKEEGEEGRDEEEGSTLGSDSGRGALSSRLLCYAVEAGGVGVMAWLRGRGCPWGPEVVCAAAEGGSEEQLEWLAQHGCPMGVSNSGLLHDRLSLLVQRRERCRAQCAHTPQFLFSPLAHSPLCRLPEAWDPVSIASGRRHMPTYASSVCRSCHSYHDLLGEQNG